MKLGLKRGGMVLGCDRRDRQASISLKSSTWSFWGSTRAWKPELGKVSLAFFGDRGSFRTIDESQFSGAKFDT